MEAIGGMGHLMTYRRPAMMTLFPACRPQVDRGVRPGRRGGAAKSGTGHGDTLAQAAAAGSAGCYGAPRYG